MSAKHTTSHHADWLSLVEISGPFVSMPVLRRVFPQGLEPRDPAQAKALRAAYEEWQDNPTAPGRQHAWVWHVLMNVLGYPEKQIATGQAMPAGLEAALPEMGETLRPDFALVSLQGSETAERAQLLIVSYPNVQPLEKPVIGKHWKATPATRMMELLHGAGVPLGLVTNGEHWLLVYAPRGETTGYASWYASLWLDEPITLRAFHSLLGVRRFFGVAAESTLLTMLKKSAEDQQEVTDQLGYQVREAVEVLVQSFDALDKDSNRKLLKGVAETVLYDAALTVMMRLVFLFSAEERGLLHLGKSLYDDNYAVSTLQEQLQATADQQGGEEVLERRYDAWARLLATFRAVHSGIPHQDLLMMAYGGSLFDPDRYPFLESRAARSEWRATPAEPLAVNNRVVLHLLNSLQRLRTKEGGAAEIRRVSFRALDVEQIGNVYEGLLDHTAVRASELVLGIKKGASKKEPEIPLSVLEALLAQGTDKLFDYLKEETGRTTTSPIKRAFEEGSLLDEHKLLIACGQEEKLLKRLRPFAGLIREDSFERPLVVLTGSVFVTAGTTRRSTGTHYTPPSLTHPIVQRTLEPLVYEGPAEGWPREKWKLRSPKELLAIKVCDMAMGSGAFLVQTDRYLAERLVEAWENEEKQHPGEILITPEGGFSQGVPSERLIPAETNERIAIARRIVAERCLYGVDKNPMAVEMAKLSLWLVTVAKDRPFTFLDHALKCGDSLVGADEDMFLRWARNYKDSAATLFDDELQKDLTSARAKRRELESFDVRDVRDAERKAQLLAEADATLARIKLGCDLLIGTRLLGLKPKEQEKLQNTLLFEYMANTEMKSPDAQRALQATSTVCAFHWQFEFPEVFEEGGFSAFVGNPPFLGGKRISTFYGDPYKTVLDKLMPESNSNADICAKFHLRCFKFLKTYGTYGLVSTDRITDGDTRTGGLDQIMKLGGVIYAADVSRAWPGVAAVRYSIIHACRGVIEGPYYLDGKVVGRINAHLTGTESNKNNPNPLRSSWGTSYVGCAIQGAGFILEEEEARKLLLHTKNKEVVRPFLITNDLNQIPDLTPQRWVINFDNRDLESALKFEDCIEIVRQRVKPHRDKANRKAHRDKWWQFGDRRPGLVRACVEYDKVIACGMTTVEFKFAWVPTGWVFDQTVVIIVPSHAGCFPVLESSIHKSWAYEFASGFGSGGAPRYNPSRCFDTFPFPQLPISNLQYLEILGETYYEHRKQIMLARQEGLTKTYSRFHNPQETSADIAELRRLHMEMDNAVAAAYGWSDLDLGHGFHDTKQGLRYTLSESARREVLARLLKLNHERWEEEQKEKSQIPNAKAQKGKQKKATDDSVKPRLFD